MRNLFLNLRHALRSLAHAPLVSGVAVVSLGCALGITTALFAAINAMRHPPELAAAPSELYEIQLRARGRTLAIPMVEISHRISATARFPSEVAAERWMGTAVLQTPIDQRAVAAAHVTRNYFDVLGVRPEAGQLQTLPPGSAVITHQLWRMLFGRRTDLRGARVVLNDSAYSVAAVLPAAWVAAGFPSVLFSEPDATPAETSSEFVRMFARLRSGVSEQQANAELRVFAREVDAGPADKSLRSRPVSAELRPFTARTFSIAGFQAALVGGAALMLVIACANVAILLLVRATSRASEMAVRAALGAGRAHLVGVVIAESAVLTTAAAVLGLLVGAWLIRLSSSAIPDSLQAALGTPRANVPVFLVGIASAAVATLLGGLMPALRAVRVDPIDALKDSPAMTSQRVKKELRGFVVTELAVSFVLLAGVALIVQSILAAGRADFGIDLHGLYRTKLSPWDASQMFLIAEQGRVDSAQRVTYDLEQRLNLQMRNAVTRVHGVLATGSTLSPVSVPQQTIRSERSAIVLQHYSIVSSGFFRTLGLDRGGMGGATTRGAGAREAVVNTVLAQRLYGTTAAAIGRMLWIGGRDSKENPLRITAVVPSFTLDLVPGAEQVETGELYVVDDTILPQGSDLVIRTMPGTHGIARAVADAMRAVSPRARFSPVLLVQDQNQIIVDRQQFVAALGGAVSGFGLFLTLLGLYGVVAFAAAQRRREFALRVAFGASPGHLTSLVIREGLALLAVGGILGAVITAMTRRVLAAAVYGPAASGIGYLATFVVLATLSVLALLVTWLASRQVIRVSPVSLLRAS